MTDPAALEKINAAIFYFGIAVRKDMEDAFADRVAQSAGTVANMLDMPPVPMSPETARKLLELQTLIAQLLNT